MVPYMNKEEPKLDPEINDEALKDLLGIEDVKIRIEDRGKRALWCLDFMRKEGWINARTGLKELPAAIED